MTDGARDLVVAMLRAADAAAPRPWRPGDFARANGVPDEQVHGCLELLRLEGMLEPAAGGDKDGAVVLTDAGARLAKDPVDLDYFCAEQDFALPGEEPGDNPLQRRTVAATLRTPPAPLFNRLVLWANLLVFGYGLFLAARQRLAAEFLMPFRVANGGKVVVVPNRALEDILVRSGNLTRADFLAGRWWRLLACCFVHFGVIHLAMNMLALRVVGANVEWAWGGWRYLAIYLLAGFGGSCAALTTAGAVAGASGALCGLVAAEAAWLVLNRRYLPRRMVTRQLGNLFVAGLLIGAISLASMVSGAGHLGGAVVGAVAAVLLHWHRFAGGAVRVLALLALLALPAGCLLGLKQVSLRSPDWRPAVEKNEREALAITAPELDRLDDEMRALHKDRLTLLLAQHAGRRDPDEVRRALPDLARQVSRCRGAADRLVAMGPFQAERAEEERRAALDYFRKRAEFMELIRRHLEEKRAWNNQRDREAEVAEAQQRWYKAVRKRNE
jgi:membrane associated rhomboid family serine protease